MRWSLLLQNYDYEIERRGNTRMKHVDALSRVQNILVLKGNTFEQTLSLKQTLDDDIVRIKFTIEKKTESLSNVRVMRWFSISQNK